MKRILTNLTHDQLKMLDKLVKEKGYSSRSEAVRDALVILAKSEKFPELRKILGEGSTKKQIKKKIIYALKKHTSGLSLLDISKAANLHRHTVRKYVKDLASEGFVVEKQVGASKICSLSRRRFKP